MPGCGPSGISLTQPVPPPPVRMALNGCVLKQLKNIEPVAGPKVHLQPEVKPDPPVRPELPSITRRRRQKNKNQNKRWTQTEDQFLRDHAGKRSSRRIATLLGRSVGSISIR